MSQSCTSYLNGHKHLAICTRTVFAYTNRATYDDRHPS